MTLNLDTAELPADAVEVGRIMDAWGVKGWFKIQPYSATPEALFSSKRWFLLPPDRGAAPFQGCRKMVVMLAKDHSDSVVAQAQGVTDRTDAEALRGVRVFVARSSFPTAAKDEYYWVDLIGLTVINREAVELGQVKELLSTGPQTVLVLAFEHDGKQSERMIPFVASFIDDVNLADKVITVDWQPDY